jgi:hypothetical protein
MRYSCQTSDIRSHRGCALRCSSLRYSGFHTVSCVFYPHYLPHNAVAERLIRQSGTQTNQTYPHRNDLDGIFSCTNGKTKG